MAAMVVSRPRRASAAIVFATMVVACAAPPVPPASPRSAAAAIPSVSASAIPSPDPTPGPELTATALSERIGPDVLQRHLDALQAIADESGGTRATGTTGFDRSVAYVLDVLTDAGYAPQTLPFEVGGVTSRNVVVERGGDGEGVVILGAHLDSVAVGPGMNDNATGVTALLAIAEALQQVPPPSVTVRFAFWGAEEGGPFGSASYVDALDAALLADIRAYLNFDMLGSPNGLTFVYDEPGAAPGSDAITNLVTTYFERRGLPWDPIDLAGDSDHGPFTDAGIPTGGLFAGGREDVTESQATRHGAIAGQPADACSHQACDTIANVDLARLALMTDAIAAILVAIAGSPSG